MVPSKTLGQDHLASKFDSNLRCKSNNHSIAIANVPKTMSPDRKYDLGKITLREFAAETYKINKFGLNVIIENGEARVEWSL